MIPNKKRDARLLNERRMTYIIHVGVPRIELGPRVPETRILPLYYTPLPKQRPKYGRCFILPHFPLFFNLLFSLLILTTNNWQLTTILDVQYPISFSAGCHEQ